jgi:hypothetical protein
VGFVDAKQHHEPLPTSGWHTLIKIRTWRPFGAVCWQIRTQFCHHWCPIVRYLREKVDRHRDAIVPGGTHLRRYSKLQYTVAVSRIKDFPDMWYLIRWHLEGNGNADSDWQNKSYGNFELLKQRLNDFWRKGFFLRLTRWRFIFGYNKVLSQNGKR